MLLRGKNGEKIYLTLEGDNRKKDNWFNVTVNAELPNLSWKASDRCLQYQEIQGLIHWLSEINQNVPTTVTKEFIEPEISFKHLSKPDDELKILRLAFNHNLLPENVSPKDEISIDITVKTKELNRIIRDFETAINLNP